MTLKALSLPVRYRASSLNLNLCLNLCLNLNYPPPGINNRLSTSCPSLCSK